MKKSLIFFILLVFFIFSFSFIRATSEISVELYIPDYFQGADDFKHPKSFIAGDDLKILGDFPSDEILLKIYGPDFQKELEVKESTREFVHTQLPIDLSSGTYSIILFSQDIQYQVSLPVLAVQPLDIGGSSGSFNRPSALLYDSIISRCYGCYWELSLAGNPENSQQLFWAAASGSALQSSYDGGKTWKSLSFPQPGPSYGGDPSIFITPEGVSLIAGVGTFLHPADRKTTVIQGVLIRSTQDSFDFLPIEPAPQDLPPVIRKIFDYEKLAYDPVRDLVYIIALARWSFTEPIGPLKPTLFTLSFEGELLSKNGLLLSQGYLVESMDTNVEGLLRAVRFASVEPRPPGLNIKPSVEHCKISVLRFDEQRIFDEIEMQTPFLCSTRARMSSQSDQGDEVYTGPEIAIDKFFHKNRIYVLWAQPESIIENPEKFEYSYYAYNFDIFFSYSDDDGVSWSAPQMINEVTAGDQTFPSLSIDKQGTVHVSYLSQYADVSQFDVYYAKIVDGKVSKNIRVNAVPTPHADRWREPGDYLDMVVGYPEKVYVGYPCAGDDPKALEPQEACISALNPRMVPLDGEFFRGDSNSDEKVDISDAIYILSWLFNNGKKPSCTDAADANDDGRVDISDAVKTLNFLFKSGENDKLPAPYPEAGIDLTNDGFFC